jgi:signal transduction histidine kinase
VNLPARPLSQPWLAYLVAGFAATGVYYLLPWNSAGQGFLYDAIGASAAVAAVVGAHLNRTPQRAPWYLFGAGLLAFAVGDTIFTLYENVWHRAPPIPSAADVFYLLGYPFLAVGLALLIRKVDPTRRLAGLFDAAILCVAFALVQWVFLIDDAVHGAGSTAASTVNLLYPTMDVVLVAGLAIFLLTPTWRTASYRFLAASIVILVVADEIYGASPDTYTSTSWLDSFWLSSYVLWGVAALHPTMRLLSEPRAGRQPQLHPIRVVFLAGALLTAPTVLLIQHWNGEDVDAVAIAIAAAALALLVLGRLARLVSGLDRLRRDEIDARAEAEFAQRLLAEQNERLREADRLKDEFVALISHDLRTPLTSIMGYLELTMDDRTIGEDTRSYLEIVQRNSDRLLRLVNDLLFVARVEAGELDLRRIDIGLAAIVRQSVEEATPRARDEGVDLRAHVQDVPDVRADRGRMFQLLDNLISNAIKFTPAGGHVDVRLAAHDARVRLEVADTGIGISAAEQARLFERFFRASSATERHIPGTGLGLYIASAIVDAHGGEIDVQSEPGAGTTFVVELPVASPAHKPSAELVG